LSQGLEGYPLAQLPPVFQIQIQLDDRTSKIVTSNASKLFQQKLSPINNEKLNKTGWW
jgi:hypothetical protein